MIRSLLSIIFLLSASLFFISTAVAMLRFKDVYARLHASSKCLTGGSLSILIAYLLQVNDPFIVFKVFLVGFFMLLTNPLASHALARAAYNQNCSVEYLDVDQYREEKINRGEVNND